MLGQQQQAKEEGLIRHTLNNDVLDVHVYGREGLEHLKSLTPDMLADRGVAIRHVVVKVHFARPEDVNGGDKLMSCMFAHSLTRLIAIICDDDNQIEHVNRESSLLTRHGIQARAFKTMSDMADWVEQELPLDALACTF
jgi:hypothetical protein